MSKEYFSKKGELIDYELWDVLMQDQDYFLIKNEVISIEHGTLDILTQWFGIAKEYGPNGALIITTTLTVRLNGKPKEARTYRYATEEEALKHYDALMDVWAEEYLFDYRSRFSQVAEEL